MLAACDLPSRLRPRLPCQNDVMGQSAKNHAHDLIVAGRLFVPSDAQIQWHWCHLVAFTMLPTKRAQVKRNLFACTSACNGHMANIEYSVKRLITETKKALSVEVTVSVLEETHIGHRIRYEVSDTKSGLFHREYFDALTEVRSDVADLQQIYEKLRSAYDLAESTRKRDHQNRK
jgi:hypothetical protein